MKVHWGWVVGVLALALALCAVQERINAARAQALVSSLSAGYQRRIIAEREAAALQAAAELPRLREQNAVLIRHLRHLRADSGAVADPFEKASELFLDAILADIIRDELQYSYGRDVVVSCEPLERALFVTVRRETWDDASQTMREAMVLTAVQLWRAACCVPDKDMALVIFKTQDGKIVGSSSRAADGKMYRSIVAWDYRSSSTMVEDLPPLGGAAPK